MNNLTKSKIARAEESDVSNLVHRELTFHSKELEGRKAVDSLKRVLSHGASGSPGASAEQIAALEAENASLKAKIATDEGFWPDIISTDIHRDSRHGPCYDLPTVSRYVPLRLLPGRMLS